MRAFLVLSFLSLSFSFLFFPASALADSCKPIRGFYEVPVADQLKPFSVYEVELSADHYETTPSQISFPLPSTLLGEEARITMAREGEQGSTWSGPNVRGTCEVIEGSESTQSTEATSVDSPTKYIKQTLRCTVRFGSFSIDLSKLESAIRDRYRTEEEISGRLLVARAFGAEPIGILIYEMPNQTCEE